MFAWKDVVPAPEYRTRTYTRSSREIFYNTDYGEL